VLIGRWKMANVEKLKGRFERSSLSMLLNAYRDFKTGKPGKSIYEKKNRENYYGGKDEM
jgi:hypothetical protein